MTTKKEPIWIARELYKCSGCRKCEIACSLFHENQIWPTASRVTVFMLVPGLEFPHLCAQCEDYPCVKSCPVEALSISKKTAAVLVNNQKCIACGKCIVACPGRIPHMHPNGEHIVICDLCNGNPQCVKACEEGSWNVLRTVKRRNEIHCKLYARKPEEITRDLAARFYGKKGEEYL